MQPSKTLIHGLGACALALTSLVCLAGETDSAAFTGPAISLGVSTVKSQLEINGSDDDKARVQQLKANKVPGNYSSSVNSSGRSTPLSIDFSYGVPLSAQWVTTLGASYDFGKSSMNTTLMSGSALPTLQLKSTLKQHIALYIAPGMRIGSQWLVYAKGGYHQIKADYSSTKNSKLVESTSFTHRGFGYGIGTVYAATRNIEARVEVEQVNFKAFSSEGGNVKPKMTRANLLVGYRF